MSASIVAGPDALLVDLSKGGALLELAGRLSLGSAVKLRLIRDGGEVVLVTGRVAWQKVASIAAGKINYRVAVAFDVPLADSVLADSDAPAVTATSSPEPEAQPERSPAVVPFPTAQPKLQLSNAPTPAAAASAEVEDLRRKLGAAKADLSCQAAILESLAAKLKDSEQQRTALIRQLADAVKRGEDLQVQLDAREQKYAAALREQQVAHESIVAEMLKVTSERQAEYLELLGRHQLAEQEHAKALREQQEAHEAILADRLKAASDQQVEYRALLERYRAAEEEHANALREQQEGNEAIVAEMLKAANDQQEQYRVLFERHQQDEARGREMEARVEAAEALCAAHQDRYGALRRETEKLMRMIDAAAASGLERNDTKAAAS